MNYVRLEVSESLKARDTPAGKPLMHKEESSLVRKCGFNYRSAFGMLSYLQISTRPDISMDVHQCSRI